MPRSRTSRSAPYGRAGSKVRLAPWITWIASSIDHTKWGELFAGSCAVTLHKDAVSWEFLCDLDKWISNFLAVLRNRRQKAELLRRLRYTAWEKTDFDQCSEIIKGKLSTPDDPVECARVFLVNNAQSYNKSGRTHSRCDTSSGISKWKQIHEYIDSMARRIADCHVIGDDYAKTLQFPQVNDPKTLIYADPPYLNVEKMYYAENKQTGFDHHAFRKSLDDCQASIIVSYEDCPPIRELYLRKDGWQIEERVVTRSLGNNAKSAKELLLIRPSEWAAQQSKRVRYYIPDIFSDETETSS